MNADARQRDDDRGVRRLARRGSRRCRAGGAGGPGRSSGGACWAWGWRRRSGRWCCSCRASGTPAGAAGDALRGLAGRVEWRARRVPPRWGGLTVVAWRLLVVPNLVLIVWLGGQAAHAAPARSEHVGDRDGRTTEADGQGRRPRDRPRRARAAPLQPAQRGRATSSAVQTPWGRRGGGASKAVAAAAGLRGVPRRIHRPRVGTAAAGGRAGAAGRDGARVRPAAASEKVPLTLHRLRAGGETARAEREFRRRRTPRA